MSSSTIVFSLVTSFLLGYLVSYLNFFQAVASIFTDYSSIQNKVYQRILTINNLIIFIRIHNNLFIPFLLNTFFFSILFYTHLYF